MIAPFVTAAGLLAGTFGLWQPGNNPVTYSIDQTRPTIAVNYFGWEELPNAAQLQAAATAGTTVFIELQTGAIPLADITAGDYDAYLQRFTDAITAAGVPVMVTFDHEMNGGWYPWGKQPAAWIAAWNHVTDTINNPLVTWVFAPNVDGPGVAPVRDYWHIRNVDAVGVDGYLNSPGDTYWSVFAATTGSLRRHWPHKPLFIAEAGVRHLDRDRGAQIRSIACTSGLPVVYFDARDWHLGPYQRQLFLWCQTGPQT